MARRGLPKIDPRDPNALSKALNAIEENFLEIYKGLELVESQRKIVDLKEVRRSPDNAPVPTGITTTFNQDGSMTVELTWTYAQGHRPSTQMVVLVKKGAAPLAAPVLWEDDVYTLPAGAVKARLDLPSEHNYRFGVATARGTPDGLAVGEIQAPTANPDWADIGGVTPSIIGGPVGALSNLAADVTLTEATWVSVASITATIPAWAVDSKVLLSASINVGATITTAGVYKLFYRWKRGATVLFTSQEIQIDTTIIVNGFYATSTWMDSTALTGNVTYSLEMFKDDQGAANNLVKALTGSQFSLTHWSK